MGRRFAMNLTQQAYAVGWWCWANNESNPYSSAVDEDEWNECQEGIRDARSASEARSGW